MALTKIDDRGLKTPIDLLDNEKIRFGTGNDLELYHDGSHSRIVDSGTGNLMLQSDRLVIANANNSENMLVCDDDTTVELYYNGVKKFETSSYGIWLADNTRVTLGGSAGTPDCHFYHDATDTNIQNITGDLVIKSNSDGDKAIVVKNGAATELYYDNAKKFETTANGVLLADDVKITLGNNDDFSIYHSPNNNYIDADTGTLHIRHSTETGAKFIKNGSVELYYDNVKTFNTTSTGIEVRGGEGSNCELYMYADEGDDNADLWKFVSATDGNFYLQEKNTGSWVSKIYAQGGAGKVCLRHGSTDRFETTSTGVAVSGRGFETGTFSASGGSTGIKHDNWSNNELGIAMSHQVTGGQTAFAFYNPNGLVGYIQTSASATVYNTSSDYRLKENQVLISDGITRLKQLKPYRFNFKKDPSTTLDGFFAHEVESVVPQAVSGTKDQVATKDEGERKIGDPIFQGMDYGRITPLLTAALQEAITEIETLKTKVAALEAG